MKLKKICFDIDNVLCRTNAKKEYSKSKPIKKNIKLVNEIFNKGYYVILYTARYMGRYNGNITKVKKKIRPLTLKQLTKWEVKYHKVYFGKPSFDLFIDDKSLFFTKEWPKLLKNKLKI
jgi:capsule biosynthesis phosphatase|tara:strand:+ start:973 stop:1329 length:357 start_codon:yes stop_codon:yes gene_type:complete